ncbi:MAG: bifunctional 2-polyprenyl-6-hydroxyphenol methylase/3-demethylubiquinol 3-O-methyltransferase UbiG [Bdellovibrionales bacterium]
MSSSSLHRSVSPQEVARFSAQSGDWWNPEGAFKPLHKVNPLRARYARDQVCARFGREEKAQGGALRGLTILDLGCGGGILSEPLARMGGKVVGVDASEQAIEAARAHAEEMSLEIDYRAGTAEALAEEGETFDVVTAMEIVEHVADLGSFLNATARLVKPGGLLILSTLNRTMKSYLLAVVGAEYALGWVPRGTHDWNLFVRPSELVARVEKVGLKPLDLTGMAFNPLRGAFQLRRGAMGVNYFLTAGK